MSKIVHGPTEIQPIWPDRKCEYTAEILRLRAENEKLRAVILRVDGFIKTCISPAGNCERRSRRIEGDGG